MNKLIKKLNNFKLTALIGFIISAVAGLYCAGAFVCYHFTGGEEDNVRKVGFTNTLEERYVGMVFFFLCLIAIGLAIYIAYSYLPFVRNKEKLSPRRSLLLLSTINSVLQCGIIVLSIILLVKEHPMSSPAIIATLPFGILAFLGSFLSIIPFIKCNFYMPDIKRD